MIARDMDEVLEVENTASPLEPWDEDYFLKFLKGRNTIGMVAELNEEIVGFMVYSLLIKKQIFVYNFAVHSLNRRCGIGTQMMDKLFSKLKPQKRDSMIIFARESNFGALKFLRSKGFMADKLVKESFKNGEDAYRLRYNLKDQDDYPLQAGNRISKTKVDEIDS